MSLKPRRICGIFLEFFSVKLPQLNEYTDYGKIILSKHISVFLLFVTSGLIFKKIIKLITKNNHHANLSTIFYLLYPYLLGHSFFNIKDIPKETLEFLESPAESSPNSILKRRLNIKPIEPKPEVKIAPIPEVKAPAPVVTKKKLNIKPVEQPEVVKTPAPETEIMKKPAAPITKKKLNIKPIQDLSTNSGYSTNLEPLPPLPFNKKIVRNIPKSSHQPEKKISSIENNESGKPSSMAPLPIKKLTIKDIMPPEQLEKPEKSGKVGKPVISGSKPESSAVDPKNLDSREGEGYLIALSYLGMENRSDLMIFDAENVSSGPLAKAMLPHRIPYGFHGNWRQG